MSRLVEAKPKRVLEGAVADAAAAEQSTGDKVKAYGERVAKYVPAEVLAFYTGCVQLILTREGDSYATFRMIAFAVIGLAALIGTPIWLGKFATDPATKKANQRMGLAAFLTWAYAYPAGIFAELGLHDAVIAGIALLAFSFVSGFYQPQKPAGT